MLRRIRGNKILVISVIVFLVVTAVYGSSIFLTGGSLLFGERPDGNTQMMVPEAVPIVLQTTESGIVIKGADAVLEVPLRRPGFLSQNTVPKSEEFVLIVEDWGRSFRTSWAPEGLAWSHVRHYDKVTPGGNFVPSDIRVGNEYRVLLGLEAPDDVEVDQTMRLTMAEKLEIRLEKGVTQVILVQ